MPVDVVVELPQYSLTLNVQVSTDGTVLDIKQEIAKYCPGEPKVEGQRLISRGRILKDTEKINTLWLNEGEARVVHLAVKSWSSTPPEIPETSFSSTPLPSSTVTPPRPAPQYTTRPSPLLQSQSAIPNNFGRPILQLPYVRQLHNKALRALSRDAPTPPDNGLDSYQKEIDMSVLRQFGIVWPTIFDKEFPPPTDGGVTYEYTMIAGKPYLQNLTPYASPTLRQQHALGILAFTFPFLDLSFERLVPPASSTVLLTNPPVIQNQLAANNRRAVNLEVRLPLRALLTPLLLLCLRTLLLVYLFSPARKPVFSIMLTAWVLYEAWGAVRGAFGDVARDENGGNAGAGAARQAQRAARNDNGNQAAAAFNPHQNPGRFRNMAATSADAILTRLSQFNLANEDRALNAEPGATDEPGVFNKIQTFFSLLLLTLHPAYWDRRRAALRSREGRVRTEANAREAAALSEQGEQSGEGDERAREARQQLLAAHARRPAWVRDYVERVRGGEWADD